MSSYKGLLDMRNYDDDDDEDISDDEVFTQNSGSITFDENGVNKPLMAPRQRTKDGLKTRVRKVPPLRMIWASAFYFFIMLSIIIGIIFLVVFVISVYTGNMIRGNSRKIPNVKWVPCSKITTQDVWVKTFPKLTTETAIRLNDVNGDGTEDIIFAFGTGADAFYYPPVVCKVYFPDANSTCGGGISALDGKTGTEIWRHYTAHEIFALNCNVDLNDDGIKDCVGGGRMAGFLAVSGKTGKLLWDFDDAYAKIETSNVYTPQYVSDINGDGIPDLVAVHGGDPMKKAGSPTRLVGRLMLVSGKTGSVLRWANVPDDRESYYSPQVLTRPDGTQFVLFGTGGETHGGSLWCVDLRDLARGNMKKARKLHSDLQKGVMVPPVMVDITGDGVLDIIMAMFNSTVFAFDGMTLERMWAYYKDSSETYSTPAVGYFSNDHVPDFLVSYQTGPGFPVYYYTQTVVIDGRNGLPLLKKPIKMLVGTQSSPLTISVNGKGNDMFLYWVSDCHGTHNMSELEFNFLKGTSIHDQTRADFCKFRFKEKLFTRMYAISRHLNEPGFLVYDSDARKNIEYRSPINYTALGLEFLYRHPEYQEEYQQLLESAQSYDYQEMADAESRRGYRFPNMLSDPRNDENMNGAPNSQQYDDYESDDRPDPAAYSPYFSQQKYVNLGNNYYDPSEYYKDMHHNHPRYQMTRRRLTPKHDLSWTHPMASPEKYTDYSSDLKTKFSQEQLDAITKRNIFRTSEFVHEATNEKKQTRRHVGPHDAGGIQRIISTGTLAPPLKPGDDGIDIVFATFWFYPSKVQGLLPEDKQCIDDGLKNEDERFKATSEFLGLDHDAYEEMITEECLRRSGHLKKKSSLKGSDYNPFNRPMGQLTVYRVHLDCQCPSKSLDGRCAKILPFDEQRWPSYMGRNADCVSGKEF